MATFLRKSARSDLALAAPIVPTRFATPVASRLTETSPGYAAEEWTDAGHILYVSGNHEAQSRGLHALCVRFAAGVIPEPRNTRVRSGGQP